MNYKAILFDFDGVLCKDRFYIKTLLHRYPKVYDWIQLNIFGNKDLVSDWMKNLITSYHINKLISDATGMDIALLNELYEQSILTMELDKDIISLAQSLRTSGKRLGVVTDNMDVFSTITVPNHNLNKIFDVIANSADYGILKRENNGKLFDIALVSLNVDIKNSLIIDDSQSTIDLYRNRGGFGYLYNNFHDLKAFLGYSH